MGKDARINGMQFMSRRYHEEKSLAYVRTIRRMSKSGWRAELMRDKCASHEAEWVGERRCTLFPQVWGETMTNGTKNEQETKNNFSFFLYDLPMGQRHAKAS